MNVLFKRVEFALRRWYSQNYHHGKSLDKAAMTQLCLALPDNQVLRILETGGGHHSLFWPILAEQCELTIHTTTFMHEQFPIQSLREALGTAKEVHVQACTLQQVSVQEVEQLFSDPDQALVLWRQIGQEGLGGGEAHGQHAFYKEVADLNLIPKSCQALIVDGPHGHGRSLAFPLLGRYLADDAFVLIDDFDHHPFLQDLGRLYTYRECYRDVVGHRRWVLVQLAGRR